MNVAQMIAALQELPQDLEVHVWDCFHDSDALVAPPEMFTEPHPHVMLASQR